MSASSRNQGALGDLVIAPLLFVWSRWPRISARRLRRLEAVLISIVLGCTLAATLEPCVGTWDRFRLDQVVTNLVSNAVKYGAGSPIEIHLRCMGDQALLSVRDHGIGISLITISAGSVSGYGSSNR